MELNNTDANATANDMTMAGMFQALQTSIANLQSNLSSQIADLKATVNTTSDRIADT